MPPSLIIETPTWLDIHGFCLPIILSSYPHQHLLLPVLLNIAGVQFIELKPSGALTLLRFREAGIRGLVYPLGALTVTLCIWKELLLPPSLCAYHVSARSWTLESMCSWSPESMETWRSQQSMELQCNEYSRGQWPGCGGEMIAIPPLGGRRLFTEDFLENALPDLCLKD